MLRAFIDLFLPPTCPLCSQDAEQGRFCKQCFQSVQFITSPLCTCCGEPFISKESEDHFCGVCIKSRRPFSSARSVGIYKGVLLDAIHRFKYNGKTLLAKPLAHLMIESRERFAGSLNADLLVPVPLHKARLKQRGFNQSLLLSKELSAISNLPVDYLNLRKIHATDPQVNLKGKERLKNIRGAFEVKEKGVFKDKNILLIDDVYTTGATVAECSKVLKKAGASRIDVLTLARVVSL